MTTTRTIEERLQELANIIGGRAWGADKGKPRIYMPSRKDKTVYFDFADTAGDDLGGACLKVFVEDCGQHPNWYKAERAKSVRAQSVAGLAVMAYGEGDEPDRVALARDIVEDDDFDAEQIGDAARHLINGRIAEARSLLNL